ncbi:HAD-IA family hydrolase [Pseudozobellia sp. WGM2]|uniref:HAD-IA family hydrolase n=1 Tax=Pseudozobellia sp. WGM2 TaxID=2787625 RepID=UPI001AE0E0EF|nr:HAD-IA family hydrolase [Pseudozobellia sp. WGM2]
MTRLEKRFKSLDGKKVIFTDFFDTLVHRSVHPNYTLRLWAKFIIRELGVEITSEQLFSIRANTHTFLSTRENKNSLEIDYTLLIHEVFLRLQHNNLLQGVSLNVFESLFKQADTIAETSVQFKNDNLIQDLFKLKEKGYNIYLLSDFYLSKEIILKIIEHHGFSNLFRDVFISSNEGACKENGSLYQHVLNQLNIDPSEVVMIGDNKNSDILNAKRHGVTAIHLKHRSHKFRNKKNLFGTDKKDFYRVCKSIEKKCLRSEHPFSEYVTHFYFFTERLYINAKKNGIKNLYFLAREGHYLKKLFDCYQDLNQIPEDNRIKTHYLKASRQSATQLALKPLEEENFKKLTKKFGEMSLSHFLDWFPFDTDVKQQIIDELNYPSDKLHTQFPTSEAMLLLRANSTFQNAYADNRQLQKKAFISYLNSFGANYQSEGLTLVDVGWGGTMQEALYKFFNKKIPVTGYYLGLKEIYNIENDTKRFGLNFSIYPNSTFSDDILMANGQLYEQLLAAPHGSTLYYNLDSSKPTMEFHEENEKYNYGHLIAPIQDFMFERFKELFKELRSVDYTQEMVQDYMTDMALRTGIFSTKEKIKFINQLSKGFYQNVGANKVGIAYNPNQLKTSKLTLLKRFIISPEKVFRYLVKLKPFLYSKGLYWASKPIDLTYYYIKFNSWAKKKWFNKGLIS